jgi:hypothetical protein
MKPVSFIQYIFCIFLIAAGHSGFSQNIDSLQNKVDSLVLALESKMTTGDYFNNNKADRLKRLGEEKAALEKELATAVDSGDKEKLENELKELDEKIGKLNKTVYNLGGADVEIVNMLIRFETANPHQSLTELSSHSAAVIQRIDNINILQRLVRNLGERDPGPGLTFTTKEKLLKGLSTQMNLIAKNTLPWYNFSTRDKQVLKGFCIRHSNDLLTPVGLAEMVGYTPNANTNILQGNDDRDYTGGLLVEFITDYMKINRRRDVKTYQRLLFGADVYSPYFKDTTVFRNDTSFNKYDRPHASFQYSGWGTRGVSWNYLFRWDITLKIGRIGGDKAKILQTGLHQDISYSPRPQGWGAQVAAPGRFGISAEYRPEWLIKCLSSKNHSSTNRDREVFTSGFLDLMMGTYMTTFGGGLEVSNRNFYTANANYMTTRNKVIAGWFQYVMWAVRGNVKFVQHNTMLEGYGLWATTEKNDDRFTPRSLHKLEWRQVKRTVYTFDLLLSKQTRYATIFYQYSVISPETKLDNIHISTSKGRIPMDISHRWHQWATLGVCFKIN